MFVNQFANIFCITSLISEKIEYQQYILVFCTFKMLRIVLHYLLVHLFLINIANNRICIKELSHYF